MTDDAGTGPSEALGRPERGGRQPKKATAKAVKKATATAAKAPVKRRRGAWRDGGRRIVCSVERWDGRPLIGSVKDGGGPLNR